MKRSYSREIMDDVTLAGEAIDRALAELETINRFLGGRRVSRRGMELIRRRYNNDRAGVSILDIGAGGSDVLTDMKFQGAAHAGIDLNYSACRYNKVHNPDMSVVQCDAFRLPFADKSFDVVHASLFMHHFAEKEISLLLGDLMRIARKGIIINDLRRSRLALWGITILTRLFSGSRMVKNDGPLSVKRGFIRRDLEQVLKDAGVTDHTIERHWAFRWLVCIYTGRSEYEAI